MATVADRPTYKPRSGDVVLLAPFKPRSLDELLRRSRLADADDGQEEHFVKLALVDLDRRRKHESELEMLVYAVSGSSEVHMLQNACVGNRIWYATLVTNIIPSLRVWEALHPPLYVRLMEAPQEMIREFLDVKEADTQVIAESGN